MDSALKAAKARGQNQTGHLGKSNSLMHVWQIRPFSQCQGKYINIKYFKNRWKKGMLLQYQFSVILNLKYSVFKYFVALSNTKKNT